jgi:hypothetical protein
MESDSEEELKPRVKYSFILQEEDYETEDEDPDESDSDEEIDVQPWDPNDIFFRIK